MLTTGIRSRTGSAKLLRGVPLFAACSDRQLAKISQLMTALDVPSGKALTQEGRPGSEFFVIENGKARVARGGRTVATLGPGDYFGEMALLDGGPRTATVTAVEDMTVYVLDPRSFYSLLEVSPNVTRKVFRTLAQRLRAAEKGVSH